jgi:hypothetical protein
MSMWREGKMALLAIGTLLVVYLVVERTFDIS